MNKRATMKIVNALIEEMNSKAEQGLLRYMMTKERLDAQNHYTLWGYADEGYVEYTQIFGTLNEMYYYLDNIKKNRNK